MKIYVTDIEARPDREKEKVSRPSAWSSMSLFGGFQGPIEEKNLPPFLFLPTICLKNKAEVSMVVGGSGAY